MVQSVFNVFAGVVSTPAPATPTDIVSTTITPTAGNRLRYTAYAKFSIDAVSAPSFTINDSVIGDIVDGLQSFPTVPIAALGMASLTWEVPGVAAAARTVKLVMETNAGTLSVTEAYIAVDEITP